MTAAVVAALVLGVVAVGAVIAWSRAGARARALERESREFRAALLRLGEALGTGDDPAALVDVVLDAAATMARADVAVFWRDFGAFLVARNERGGAEAIDRRIAPGEGLAGWVAEERTPSLWPPGARRPAAAEPSASSALAVPVLSGGRVHGVLALYRRGSSPSFGERDLADVAELARQAGTGIDAMVHHEEARRLSLTDGLTGLWNRRQFELRLGQELERGVRFDDRFCVVLLDIDDFKLVNDRHGHPVGDEVIVAIANLLADHTREVDLVARYGGEEFALLLPRTDLVGGCRVAEKIREELGAARVATRAGHLRVTVSAGVAARPDHGADQVTLVEAADRALYRAKEEGKNRVRPAVGRAADDAGVTTR